MSVIVSEYSFDFVAHNYCFPPEDPFVLNLASKDDRIRTRSIEYVCDAVEFCHHHGIDQYTFHAGFRTDPDLSLTFPDTDIPAYDDSLETFCESLEEILDRVDGFDVALAVENNVVEPQNVVDGEPLVLLCDPSEITRLYDRLPVGGDRLGILLDTGHLRVSAATLGFDPDDFVSEAEQFLSAIHLHTNDGSEDKHRPVEPGDRELHYIEETTEPTVTIESRFESATALREHQTWLRSELDAV
jgi:sugar phosphate isomerase/epimerase